MKKILKQHDIRDAARRVAHMILSTSPPKPVTLYGVPRGGVPAAYAVASQLHLSGHPCELVDSPQAAHYIIDDIIDSGATRDAHAKYKAPFLALYPDGDPSIGRGSWLVFPWEASREASAQDIPIRLLQYIGEDPTRGGLLETPARFVRAWNHYTSGYGKDPKEILKAFDDGAEKYDDLVVVRDIPVYSHCEHHLAPFFGVAHIGYIPDGRIAGLSKFSRLVDAFSRRLQVQERLTQQIADAIDEHLSPVGVGVVLECRHMCMESRGIQRQGTTTTTSAMRGALLRGDAGDTSARTEFLGLIR